MKIKTSHLIGVVLALSICGCGKGGDSRSPALIPIVAKAESALPLTLYLGHGVMSQGSGLEPTVIVENNLVRLWFKAEDYTSPAYAPGGSAYGTKNYPFTNVRISYMEMPTAAFVTAVQNGTPLSWSNAETCVTGLEHTFVSKAPDDSYNMLGVSTTTGTLDQWQSATGSPGTWLQAKSNIADFGPGFTIGNTSASWNGASWDVYVEYANFSQWPTWRVSYWNGPVLNALTRMDSNTAPAMIGSVGHVLPTQYSGKWVHFAHEPSAPNTTSPTDISLWTSTERATGWTRLGWVLQLSSIGHFAGDQSKQFNSNSQVADPVVFEINGQTFMMYETIWKELYDVPSLSVGWWNGTLPAVVANIRAQANER